MLDKKDVSTSLTTSAPDEFQSYHPGLPSIQSAEDNYEQVYSDHLPILVSIDGMKIVSWNVMGIDVLTGFSVQKYDFVCFAESEEQANKRNQRIAKSIERFVKKHQPHCITLQKATNKLMAEISLLLPSNWAPVALNGSVITLYNTSHLTLINTSSSNNILHGMNCLFQRIDKNADMVEICNVEAELATVPEHHTWHTQQYLRENATANFTKIAIGDFSCHIAPSSTITSCLITTNVVSARHRAHQCQGAAATDGAFYSFRDSNSSNLVCKQAPIFYLNPETGKIYNIDISLLSQDNYHAEQWREITRFRPIICIDDNHTEEAWIEGYTLAEQQNILRIAFSDPSLLIYDARNLHNERALALISQNPTLQNFIQQVAPLSYFQFEKLPSSAFVEYAIYAPVKRMSDFFSLLQRKFFIKTIEQHFQSYMQPSSFFKSTRSYSNETVIGMQNQLTANIAKGKFGNSFILLQSFLSQATYRRNVLGSLAKRVILIKEELAEKYPLLKFIHEEFLKALTTPGGEVHTDLLSQLESILMQALDICTDKDIPAQLQAFSQAISQQIALYTPADEEGFYLLGMDYPRTFLEELQKSVQERFGTPNLSVSTSLTHS